MAKTASVNIRVPEELKEKLVSIAKKKDTSLNDVTSTVLADFVEDYELEQVKDDEIPSAAELRLLIEEKEKVLIEKYHGILKTTINDMAKSACDCMAFDIFKGDNLSANQKKIILTSLVNRLESLGYFTHIFTKESRVGSMSVDVDYLAISITKENIEYFRNEEEKNQVIKADY